MLPFFLTSDIDHSKLKPIHILFVFSFTFHLSIPTNQTYNLKPENESREVYTQDQRGSRHCSRNSGEQWPRAVHSSPPRLLSALRQGRNLLPSVIQCGRRGIGARGGESVQQGADETALANSSSG